VNVKRYGRAQRGVVTLTERSEAVNVKCYGRAQRGVVTLTEQSVAVNVTWQDPPAPPPLFPMLKLRRTRARPSPGGATLDMGGHGGASDRDSRLYMSTDS